MAGRQTYEARTTTKEGRGQRLRQPRFRQQRVPPKVVDRLVGTTAARRTRFSRRAYTRGSARRGRSADALSFDERSLVRNLKRPARRQRCASPYPRRSGVVIGQTGCPPLPRLRESPMCLLTARSGAACKRARAVARVCEQPPRQPRSRSRSGRFPQLIGRRRRDRRRPSPNRPSHNSEIGSARRPSSHRRISRARLRRSGSATASWRSARRRLVALRRAKEERRVAPAPSVLSRRTASRRRPATRPPVVDIRHENPR